MHSQKYSGINYHKLLEYISLKFTFGNKLLVFSLLILQIMVKMKNIKLHKTNDCFILFICIAILMLQDTSQIVFSFVHTY
jgi:hypothetical protein